MQPEQSAQEITALVGGTLIDGTGAAPAPGSVVLIKGQIIDAVGPRKVTDLPPGCRLIDVSHKTVMPGMMDLHVHLCMGEEDLVVPRGGLPPGVDQPLAMLGIKAFARARRSLEMGFTTLRDVGDFGYMSVALRDAVEAGLVEGPRILSSGQLLTTTGGHADFMPLWLNRNDDAINVADGVDGVLKAVRRQIKMRTDWIKFFATGGIMDPEDKQEFNDQELAAMIGEAHDKEKLVCAHCMHAQGTLAAVKAGVDTVEHGSELTQEIVELMVEKDTFLVPTLYAQLAVVNEGAAFGLPKEYVERFKPMTERGLKSFELAWGAGVKVALGTDIGYNMVYHGTSARELEFLVQQGLSPMEAIVTATRSSAVALRLNDKIGTIEPGKLADVVVVDGDPLAEVRVLQQKENISLVMKEGAIYVNKLNGQGRQAVGPGPVEGDR